MDVVLSYVDHTLLTPYVYPATWPEDDWVRQLISLSGIVILGGYVLYFTFATLSYFLFFDRALMQHKKFLEGQVGLEIKTAVISMPFMSALTIPIFLAEVRGYSKLYDDVDTYGWPFLVASVPLFLMFTDCLIYWIHRWLHLPFLYRTLHKPHHKWLVSSPFASHAFHPLDGFLQSCPYHIYVFLFPLQKYLYLALFVFVNIWTIMIHDGDYRVPGKLNSVINGAAHHVDHHLYFNYNYGQFFTLWDKIGGSYRYPSSFCGKDPHEEARKDPKPSAAAKAKAA